MGLMDRDYLHQPRRLARRRQFDGSVRAWALLVGWLAGGAALGVLARFLTG